MPPTKLYGLFLVLKGILNLGAAGAAFFIMKNPQMAGFWFFLAIADLWIGLWSMEV